MSKMTQRRMNRRASRKLNQLRRENRTKTLAVAALTDNISQAFKAITAQRDKLRALTGQTPAAPAQ